ncbi:MAG TPA: hypothetical protein VN428_10375 [Bryobacteraceae bacterium]|nr:hypothetical protein [Bryobacteraceae bacterium]
MNAWNSMLEISGLTGGRAFGNIHQFGDAMVRAAADSRLSYSVGYYPSHDKWDGSFREVKVKAVRPGLRLRYRTGYVALAPREQPKDERRASLEDAVWSPLDATGIPMDVRIMPASKPNTVRLMVLIDPAALAITPQDDLHICTLDFLYVQQRRDGAKITFVNDTVSLKLTPERYRQVMTQRMGVNKEFEIAPGAERLRVVVRDVQSAAVGSVTADIQPR